MQHGLCRSKEKRISDPICIQIKKVEHQNKIYDCLSVSSILNSSYDLMAKSNFVGDSWFLGHLAADFHKNW